MLRSILLSFTKLLLNYNDNNGITQFTRYAYMLGRNHSTKPPPTASARASACQTSAKCDADQEVNSETQLETATSGITDNKIGHLLASYFYTSKLAKKKAKDLASDAKKNEKGQSSSGEKKEASKSKQDSGSKKKSDSPPPKSPKYSVSPHRIFKIYRFNGIFAKDKPKIQTFELDVSKCGTMVLDALMKLKDMDPTLTFRRSCREGICGSCAMNVQGSNCLACIKAIPPATTIKIYPLPHMYVIRDLVVDMTHFLRGYDSIRPYLIRKNVKLGKFQFAQSINDMHKVVGMYECVLCSCCATACPSYWWNGRRFLGPANLMHAYRWVIDSRDEDSVRRLHDLRDDFKAFRCHTIMNCAVDCPKGLNPARSIALLKRLIAGLDKKPLPEMEPLKFSGKSKNESKSEC